MAIDISIIVVSFNARELLPACVDSIVVEATARDAPTAELIIVDNESPDGSAQWARDRWLGGADAGMLDGGVPMQVVDAGRNGGMGAGNDVGMLRARGASFLLLNSDARLLPGSLTGMHEALAAAPSAGVVGPLLRNPDGSLQRSVRAFPTVWRLATEFWYLRRLAPRSPRFNDFYGAGFDYAAAADVDWVAGACLLVRREAVDEVGLMDESYFMFSEETDWLHRMTRAGWRVRFDPRAEVEHLGGGSTAKSWGRMYEVQVANHVRYLARNQGRRTGAQARRVIASALWFRGAAYRVFAGVSRGPDRGARAERARNFAGGRRAVLAVDPRDPGPREVPAWRPATRGASAETATHRPAGDH